MITAAIITEYNPFHNGHKYQIDTLRRELNADNIVIIMSGNFVQRGEPAILNKEQRSQIALECGADLVLELPIAFATASAEVFAYAGVKIADSLGCVDYLCFGSECGNIEILTDIADKIINDNITISNPAILSMMAKGKTFAKARAEMLSEYADYLQNPNNILAIEYIKALKEQKSTILPYTIKRMGSDYNDTSLKNTYPSATAIRELLNSADTFPSKLNDYMPSESVNIMKSQYHNSYPVCWDDFKDALLYSLAQKKYLNGIICNKDLYNRIFSYSDSFESVHSLIMNVKSRNLTYSGISRTLLHIMLGISEDYIRNYKQILDELEYVKLVGINTSKIELTSQIKRCGSKKLASKTVDVLKDCNDTTLELFTLELFANTLYEQAVSQKFNHEFRPEYSKEIAKKDGE